MRYGAAEHAAEALRLVACGRAPSWRSEAVVQVGSCLEGQRKGCKGEGPSRQSEVVMQVGSCLEASRRGAREGAVVVQVGSYREGRRKGSRVRGGGRRIAARRQHISRGKLPRRPSEAKALQHCKSQAP
eukprot:364952-Chlamydomonas_euryale.AAC.20